MNFENNQIFIIVVTFIYDKLFNYYKSRNNINK
jgi:hypothetical protein